MKTTRICPTCHEPLPADAPQGLCPRCLLKTEPATIFGADAPTDDQPHPPLPPEYSDLAQHFPQLEILGLIGEGGMGVVFKARQPRLDRIVALKILPVESALDPSFTERFTREARALAKISHPGIVAIHDFGNVGPYYYFVMEFVDGVNLREMIKAQQIDPAHALGLVMQICEALQFAHDRGVVHRDIKPSNILVDRDGRVRIADFGLAKLRDSAPADVALTREHHVMGTPHYMAPEQASKPLSVDHRADIYSLGVVFYEMLTGNLPVGRFQPPSKTVHVDVRLDEVVLRTLEQEPARRYQSAKDVRTDVANIQPDPDQPREGASKPSAGGSTLATAWESWKAERSQVATRFAKGVLQLIYVAGLLMFFGVHASQTPTGLRRQVGFPTPWAYWEQRFLGGESGFSIGVNFPAWSWLVAAVALLAFYVNNRITRTQRPLKWTDTTLHSVLWLVLLVAAMAFTAAPMIQGKGAFIREIPQKRGHVADGVRWSEYALEAPVNHRVQFWMEWLKDGKEVQLPGLEFRDSFTPARGRRFKGIAFLNMRVLGTPGPSGTNTIEWQWNLHGGDATSAQHEIAPDPFQGLPITDSSYGHTPLRKPKPGEVVTLMVVRGDREALEGQPWDPLTAGRADVEMRLKARIDPVPDGELREIPQSSGTIESSVSRTR